MRGLANFYHEIHKEKAPPKEGGVEDLQLLLSFLLEPDRHTYTWHPHTLLASGSAVKGHCHVVTHPESYYRLPLPRCAFVSAGVLLPLTGPSASLSFSHAFSSLQVSMVNPHIYTHVLLLLLQARPCPK